MTDCCVTHVLELISYDCKVCSTKLLVSWLALASGVSACANRTPEGRVRLKADRLRGDENPRLIDAITVRATTASDKPGKLCRLKCDADRCALLLAWSQAKAAGAKPSEMKQFALATRCARVPCLQLSRFDDGRRQQFHGPC